MTSIEELEYREWIGHQFDKLTLKVVEMQCEIIKMKHEMEVIETILDEHIER